MRQKVIIIGGVAGGASAAARLRRLDEKAEIIMIERGEYISFANCGLPYYIGNTITERDALLVQTVADMSEKFNMDIRILSEAIDINTDKQTVTIKDLQTEEVYQEKYDKMVLSPGASPIKPPIPGIDEAKNLFTLRTIPDTDKIYDFINDNRPKSAVVVGGGFIGLEMVENLTDRGIDVTVVEMADQVMAPLDYEMAAMVHTHLRDKGVTLILEDGVKSFESNGTEVVLQSGTQLSTEMIILAIGVKPESDLAKKAGLALGERGGIQVNDYLQTSDPNIYAVGDAIEVVDYVSGLPTMIPLAGPANKQGRIVANNIAGKSQKYAGTMGTAVAKVFDLTVASTGNNEKILKRQGQAYQVLHIHPGSHAGYYPGAFPISLKILFTPDQGKILGAQAVGYVGVEKRIDVIATSMRGDLTVMDLQELELAYAPPYSSAKDPVNMLGFAATNILDGYVETFQWHEVDTLKEQGAVIVDVREREERELGYIAGSAHIPLGELRERVTELPEDQAIHVYCQVGIRGYLAVRILQQLGYQVRNLDGGYKTYQAVFCPSEAQAEAAVLIDDSGVMKIGSSASSEQIKKLNVCGLQCPGPIMQVYQNIEQMNIGEILEVTATDPGFAKDIQSWCSKMGHKLLSSEFSKAGFIVRIKKGQPDLLQHQNSQLDKDGATLVVFSGDLDKALASFIIASGAASMGKQVTMFFTFWGLNVLRKDQTPPVSKSILEKMFGWMMPKGANKLTISKMNMGGIGSKLIKYTMQKKNVDSLETLISNARKAGVRLVACAMSMDIMGIKEEELLDDVEIAGVASYLGHA